MPPKQCLFIQTGGLCSRWGVPGAWVPASGDGGTGLGVLGAWSPPPRACAQRGPAGFMLADAAWLKNPSCRMLSRIQALACVCFCGCIVRWSGSPGWRALVGFSHCVNHQMCFISAILFHFSMTEWDKRVRAGRWGNRLVFLSKTKRGKTQTTSPGPGAQPPRAKRRAELQQAGLRQLGTPKPPAAGSSRGAPSKKKKKKNLFPSCLPNLSCSASVCPCSWWWGLLGPFSQGCLLCWLCKQSRKCLSWVLCCWAAGQTCSQIPLPAPGKIPNPNSGRLHRARLSRLGAHEAEALLCCMLE